MSIKTKVNNSMSEFEKRELKDTIKGFTDEEKTEVIKVVHSEKLWEELIRRHTLMVQGINEIEDVLGISIDNICPIAAKAWSDIKERFDDIEDKFTKIAKGFVKNGN